MCTEHPRRGAVIDNNVKYHNFFPLAERLARVTNTARELLLLVSNERFKNSDNVISK